MSGGRGHDRIRELRSDPSQVDLRHALDGRYGPGRDGGGVRREQDPSDGDHAGRRRGLARDGDTSIERDPAAIDHDAPPVGEPQRRQHLVAGFALHRGSPVQEHLVGRVVGPGGDGGAEAERRWVVRSGEQHGQRARRRCLRGRDLGVRLLPSVQAVELPEAQADAGEDDEERDRGQHDRSQRRWLHARSIATGSQRPADRVGDRAR